MVKGDYPDDTFTENDVFRSLEQANLKFKDGRRYILAQCPLHDDKNPSVQIYKDDWFVNCHAGCGRFHITKAFPELRTGANERSVQPTARRATVQKVNYKIYDLMAEWKQMAMIPRDHKFKTIPLEILDDLGWRWLPDMHSYFIPYFSASKRAIPFAQYRHLRGDRRFTMLKDAKPTCYGTWNLDNPKLFIVEGTSDSAVLEYCSVPWIGVPSAASSELIKSMSMYCQENGLELTYAGDNDSAGDKLREALDEIGIGYRVKQPPKEYKDWGDYLEATNMETVQNYCFKELFPEQVEKSDIDKVLKVFPGAKPLKIVDSDSSKEQETEPTLPLY